VFAEIGGDPNRMAPDLRKRSKLKKAPKLLKTTKGKRTPVSRKAANTKKR
jgi:hypothetical protein